MKLASTLLVACAGILLSIGLVMLYSSGIRPGATTGGARYLLMQLAWVGIGLITCAVAAGVDYRWLRKLAWPLLALSFILLVLILIPSVGILKNGARRWLSVGFGNFQPSELAKLALIVVLAWYCERHEEQMRTWNWGLARPGLVIAPMLALIFIEPDRGTTILLAVISVIMLLTAGLRWLYVLPPVITAAMGLAYSLWRDPVRVKRILSWLYPESHKDGVGWQAWQGMIGLGSGGWTGLGLGNGRQKFGFIPEHHTDFIFSIIGEELGLVATLSIIVLFIVLVFCGIYIAWNAADTFGLLLGTGITFLIGLQAFINIGVVTSLLPNKGLPLPFISYGGSNLLLMLTCVGILFSIARHSSEENCEMVRTLSSDEALATQQT